MPELTQGDQALYLLFGGLAVLLAIASAIGWVLARRATTPQSIDTVRNLVDRINAWWVMVAVLAAAFLLGRTVTLVVFGLMAYFALREFVTLTPTRRADHEPLFWAFFVFLPLQYWLVGTGWYGMFTILIPVYGFLFLPLRSALNADAQGFLARTARTQWALMVCVYCVSHAPALLTLELPGFDGSRVALLLWLLLVVQLSDVLQYVWGKLAGRRPIVPRLSPNKTVEGFAGGIGSASLIGTLLAPVTPFTHGQAFGIALLVCLLGFAGGLVMSAIKRDAGIKDFGAMIEGHGGVLDRIDSLCFSAPVFFHVVRYFWSP